MSDEEYRQDGQQSYDPNGQQSWQTPEETQQFDSASAQAPVDPQVEPVQEAATQQFPYESQQPAMNPQQTVQYPQAPVDYSQQPTQTWQQDLNGYGASAQQQTAAWQPSADQNQAQPTQAIPPIDAPGVAQTSTYPVNNAQPINAPYQQYAPQTQQPVDQNAYVQNGNQPGQYVASGATGPQGVPGAPGSVPAGVPPMGMPPQGAYGAPMPGQPQKRKKGLGVIIGIIVGVIVIAVIAACAYFFLFKPSLTAQDYLEASTKLDDISSEYYDVTSDMSQMQYYDDSDVNSSVSDLKDGISKLQQIEGEFSSLKAYKDDEVKQAYDTYTASSKQFTDYMLKIADVYPALKAVETSCGDTPYVSMYDSDFADQYSTFLSSCKTKLEALSNTDVQSIKDFATSMSEYVTKLSDIVDQLKELGNIDDIEYGSDQYNKLSDIVDEYYELPSAYEAASDFQTALSKEIDDVDPSDELQAVQDLLGTKIQEAKR